MPPELGFFAADGAFSALVLAGEDKLLLTSPASAGDVAVLLTADMLVGIAKESEAGRGMFRLRSGETSDVSWIVSVYSRGGAVLGRKWLRIPHPETILTLLRPWSCQMLQATQIGPQQCNRPER